MSTDNLDAIDLTNEQLQAAILAAGWQCDGFNRFTNVDGTPSRNGFIVIAPPPIDADWNTPESGERLNQVGFCCGDEEEAWLCAFEFAEARDGGIRPAWTPETTQHGRLARLPVARAAVVADWADPVTLILSRADATLMQYALIVAEYASDVDKTRSRHLLRGIEEALAAPAEGPERFDEAIPATGASLERVGYEVVFAYPDELAPVRAAAKRDGLTVGAWIKHAAMRAAEGPERAATGEG